MLIERVPLTVEDPVERVKVAWVRVQPSFELFGPKVDDGVIVPCRGDFRFGFVRYRNERKQVRRATGRVSPVRL
jgi:hypothetical protein